MTRARRFLLLAALLATAAGCAPATYPPNPRAFEDARLTAQVKTALLNAADLDATKIDVRAVDGAVTLAGEVPAEDHARKAIELARQVPGVRGVRSTIVISRPPRRTSVRS